MVGSLPKDKHHGKLVDMYSNAMGQSGFTLVDVAAGFADLFSIKEAPEVMNHKKVREVMHESREDVRLNTAKRCRLYGPVLYHGCTRGIC